jgi:hypothetical protein
VQRGLWRRNLRETTTYKTRCRWEDKIKMYLQEMEWGHGLDQSGSEQGQVVGSSVCDNEPSCSMKYGVS